tara:strand:+ start:345 stop:746 length:402 start_codon:yes stop_codon:yes gene_type:complete
MEMGVIKPFEVTRSVAGSGALEAGAGSMVGKQTETAQDSTSAQAVTPQTREAVQEPAQVDREQLQAAVSDIQDFVQSVRRDINFALDEDSGRMIINVTEASSGDVIRQIPSEEALRLAENLTEIRSVLFEAEA